MFDSELENFKRNIDLRSYAAGQAYQLDRKESWRGSSVMRHPVSNDKVIIKRGMDGHYVYFSVRDDRDNGTIIDFVQHRQGLSLGGGTQGAAAVDWSTPCFGALLRSSA